MSWNIQKPGDFINGPLTVTGTATITGNLTVDTNTLFVNAANNRVGILTASPTEPLTIDNTLGIGTTGALRVFANDQSQARIAIQNTNGQAYHFVAGFPGASNAGFALFDNTAAATRWYVDNTGVHSWQNVGGVAGTAMTLNSTGLGVGVTPSAWQSTIYKVLEFSRGVSLSGQTDAASMELTCNAYIDSAFSWIYKTTAAATHYRQFAGAHQWHIAPSGTAGNAITFTQAMTLDASGNLLVGTTSTSGSSSNATALVFGGAKTASGSVSATTAVATTIFSITAALTGRYEVVALVGFSGAPAQYTAIATIIWDGNGSRVVANNGANLTITISGSNVQITQTSGSTQTVSWSFLRIAL